VRVDCLAETKEVQMVVQRAVSSAQKKVDCWVEKTVVQMVVSSAQKKVDCLAEMTQMEEEFLEEELL
jgi:hypothetical protein